MAFGNKDCNYEGFSCGEQPRHPSTDYEKKNPHAHQGGLIGLGGKLARPVDSAVGDRIALSIHVTGDTAGVCEALEATLARYGVSFQATDWDDRGRDGKEITFHNIPVTELASLGKAVAEIEKERGARRGLA